ncbi:histidinol-phosphate transaminase [Pseudoxanthomonas broegbernensis]|uniref:Histidinol-phosphate aminotransferase n=1 Tax=Pseudoxanthomonas broegbernensis TaxID=83619 RepID=A0A7V8GPD8_9GAMM|nr:histidinol-phosphate transaminase [Pseudoxanthomonas broegbernensis]KAF1687609.1 histidinol-phosphate transaminase [Pseudoxanthomonas broegbernensis]MBB6064631.1 histidinol-phosphate aminotransferase [Pseudoxanthomonas broegbernensis]
MNAADTRQADDLLRLVREDLRGFGGYASARTCDLRGEVWLNANESPWANPADAAGGSRRYPEPQPPALRQALARLYGCAPEQVLVGRGSDEAIDLLVRALCVPARDAIVTTPPVFGMYAVSARLQDARLIEVPLVDGQAGFGVDLEAVAVAAERGGAKLVFLCSPSNPTGGSVPLEGIAALAARLAGRALVVVDEAYGEFSESPSAIALMPAHRNVAVLRTLSKAHALAAARIGTLLADPALVRVLRACQAPYPIPTPCADLAVAGLSQEALARTAARVEQIRGERERLARALAALRGVVRVYPSDGNYLLVRFADAGGAFARLLAAGVVVRDQRAAPQLGDALRISLGTPEENDRVLDALDAKETAA